MPTLPVVGKVPRGWLIAVGAGSLAAIGYVLYRRHQAAAASATAPATTPSTTGTGDPYPPDGSVGNPSDPNSTDPATGMTYGDEQLSGGGFVGGFGGFPGATGGGSPVSSGTNPTGGPPFGTNADWANYAEQQLSGFIDPATLSAALGVYLTGRPASQDQVSLIDQAVAIAGYPPVAGPGNFPPNIKQGGGPGPGGGKAQNPVTGLKQIQQGFTGSDVAWNPATGATSYTVTATKGNVVMLTATSARIQNISTGSDRGDQTTVTVLAQPAAAGAKPASLVVHTRSK